MQYLRHLPREAALIAQEQGWNEDSMIMLLVQFIKEKGLSEELISHLDQQADEENEAAELWNG